MNTLDLLCCPLCHSPLVAQDKTLRCDNNHCFDRARQGYYHLLPVQKKRSKHPGDDAAMVAGRRHFLDLGHYQPIADAVCDMAIKGLTDPQPALLDCGCGEGYYTSQLLQQLQANGRAPRTIGLDISKEAVRQACRRSREISWIVASGADAPLTDHCLDGLTCLFTPFSADEMWRLLKPDALLIVAGTGKNHLIELRQQIYDEVKEQVFDPLAQLQSRFEPLQQQTVSHQFNLSGSDNIARLLAMTPHQWRTSADARQRLSRLEQLSLTIDVNLYQLKPRP